MTKCPVFADTDMNRSRMKSHRQFVNRLRWYTALIAIVCSFSPVGVCEEPDSQASIATDNGTAGQWLENVTATQWMQLQGNDTLPRIVKYLSVRLDLTQELVDPERAISLEDLGLLLRLSQYLLDPERDIAGRSAAAAALGWLQHQHSIPPLMAVMRDERQAPQLRRACTEALGTIQDRRVVGFLIQEGLTAADRNVAGAAATALAVLVVGPNPPQWPPLPHGRIQHQNVTKEERDRHVLRWREWWSKNQRRVKLGRNMVHGAGELNTPSTASSTAERDQRKRTPVWDLTDRQKPWIVQRKNPDRNLALYELDDLLRASDLLVSKDIVGLEARRTAMATLAESPHKYAIAALLAVLHDEQDDQKLRIDCLGALGEIRHRLVVAHLINLIADKDLGLAAHYKLCEIADLTAGQVAAKISPDEAKPSRDELQDFWLEWWRAAGV